VGDTPLKFTAVGFDLDGTLYPNVSFYIRLVPFLLKENRLLRALDKARMQLRNTGAYGGDFYELQARLMGEILNKAPEKVRERTERLIYRGWESHFKKVRLFPRVKETLDAFRKGGIKTGLLSDFPPETKLQNLNLAGCWDAVICSERTGRLKPDPASFLDLAGRMGVPPGEVLYVGNSVSYDVQGAHRAGMKAALVRSRWKKRAVFTAPLSQPDFVFYDYRQLCDYVLN